MPSPLRAFFASIAALLLFGSTATPGFSQAQQSTHAWAGTVFDGFTLDGNVVWSVEDGGKIRHRNSAGVWSFQTVPVQVRDPLMRIHFLSDGLRGWAVSKSGHLIRTTDGGANWIWSFRKPGVLPGAAFEELWDIFMLDENIGWMCGLHSIWYTQTGGQTNADWIQVTLLDQNGVPITNPAELEEIEIYSLDVALGTDPPILALASAEPGLVFRPLLQPIFDPLIWKVVYDARVLCSTPQALEECQKQMCPPDDEPYEPWIVTISRNPAHKLALVIGGWGFHCAMILASTDDGVTWTIEPHECVCLGSGGGMQTCPPPWPCIDDPLYNDDLTVSTDTWRWKTFETMYGGMITDGNGGAVAVGYGGQTVVRDPSAGVWRDRSVISSDYVQTTTAVTTPQRGVVAPPSAGANGVVYAMGLGGYIRRSTDGGQTFVNETVGEPWRFGDLWFFDDIHAGNHGWMVSQFFRIAESFDGGKHWAQRAPDPELHQPKFLSIGFAVDRLHGATVGQADPQTLLPKILFTTNGGSTAWQVSTHDIPPAYVGTQLREVCWASNTVAWAGGSQGLMVRSTDGGNTWRHQLPESLSTLQTFEIHGVAFADTTTGLFAGQRTGPTGNGLVYQWRKIGSTLTWTAVTLDDPKIKLVADVAISGSNAYAVGYKEDSGVRTGVLLQSSSGGSGFTSFSTIRTTPECDLREPLEGRVAVLNQVEILPNGDVMAGGECGRVWQLKVSNSTWIEHKSSLSSHIRGMSFPRSNVGYVGGQRFDLLGNSHGVSRFDL